MKKSSKFVPVTTKKVIKRPIYLEELKRFIDKPLIKVITGIRRSGKSTILSMLKEELLVRGVLENQIIYVNFESFSSALYNSAELLYEYIQAHISGNQRYYILLDEIQEVKNWEKAVNSIFSDYQTDIYITGSNSHLLSSELSTYLAGRYITIPVYTLSFKEFITFNNEMGLHIDAGFQTYLRKGGFPVIHLADYPIDDVYKIVYDIYSSVILRDTIQRYSIRDVELLERVIRFGLDNLGNTFSGKNVADYFKSQHRKTDVNTIYNYLYALEGAFIFYRVSRFDIAGKEILKTQEKFYVSDVSLLYATLGYRDRNISGILENIVFLELKRRGYRVFVGKLGTHEIDFIAEKKGNRMYIQVAYKLENESTIDREYASLLRVSDHYPKFVVSMDPFWNENIDGVRHHYLPDFLLSDLF